MNEKNFTLRVDLESEKGIREGLPRLLDLLKKYNLKASFYLVMGGESNIFEILKHNKKMTSSDERKIKIWKIADKIRMILFPRDFVKSNVKILKRILEEGHELGIHGWKHREWTRNLEEINIEKKLLKSIKKYENFFNAKPISFAAPGFNTNGGVLKVLERYGIKFVSDFPGEEPKNYGNLRNVPITILGDKKNPLIEYLISRGKNDKEIFDIMKKGINEKKLSSFYIHGLFEARFKINLLEQIFKFVKDNKIKNKRVIDY